jgi:hypothetical protein
MRQTKVLQRADFAPADARRIRQTAGFHVLRRWSSMVHRLLGYLSSL